MNAVFRRCWRASGATLLMALGAACDCLAAPPVWSAMTVDGKHVDGTRLEQWFDSADSSAAKDGSFRRLRSGPRATGEVRGPRIEFLGGDCLPGTVVAAVDRSEAVPQIEAHVIGDSGGRLQPARRFAAAAKSPAQVDHSHRPPRSIGAHPRGPARPGLPTAAAWRSTPGIGNARAFGC